MSSSGFNLQNVASTSLFVGDLSPSVNETTLYTIFNTVGPVASIKICRDVQTRNSLGYGYVNYHSLSDAEKAIKELNYSLIEGTPCRIMWSQRDPSIRMKNDSNLYIRNIEKSIETKDLHNAFYKFGTILSCKIATDVNGKSLGYGFVHYANAEAAAEAIKEMNGYKLGNKCIEVMLFLNREKKGDGKAKNFTNIYVKDFNPSWTEKELRSVFEKMGTITSLYHSVDHLSRPFACINFESHEAAKKSIDELHGKFCDELISKEVEDDKTESTTSAQDVLQVESASTDEISNDNVSSTEAKVSDSKETSSSSASEKKETIYSEKLAENNLASSSIDDATDEDQTITRNKQVDMEHSNEPVNTSPLESTKEASETKKPRYKLFICRALSKMERFKFTRASASPTTNPKKEGINLYVKNIPLDMDNEGLKKLFEPFGTITSSIVMRSQNGESKGFGFVCFANSAEATEAIGTMHFTKIGSKPLYVGLAENKSSRTARLTEEYTIKKNNDLSMHESHYNHQKNRHSPMYSDNWNADSHSATGKNNYESTKNVLQKVRSDKDNKKWFGEQLFPLVFNYQPDLAAKLTGMLLELNDIQLKKLITHDIALREKINEALAVLNDAKNRA